MVGKIKRIRQKLHHDAVKLENEPEKRSPIGILDKIQFQPISLKKTDPVQPKTTIIERNIKTSSFPSGVFAGTKISSDALVQSLKVDEASNVVASKQSAEVTASGEKKQQSKKEKIKERRERWLSKISAVKLERELHAAAKRRKATPVVGDMRPLADALPELHELTSSGTSRRKNRNTLPVKKKPDPTDFTMMNRSQKRKHLETEVSFFSDALKNPAFKKNPLAAISDHLRKRLKQEDEQS